jgi:hypothetical protein
VRDEVRVLVLGVPLLPCHTKGRSYS